MFSVESTVSIKKSCEQCETLLFRRRYVLVRYILIVFVCASAERVSVEVCSETSETISYDACVFMYPHRPFGVFLPTRVYDAFIVRVSTNIWIRSCAVTEPHAEHVGIYSEVCCCGCVERSYRREQISVAMTSAVCKY